MKDKRISSDQKWGVATFHDGSKQEGWCFVYNGYAKFYYANCEDVIPLSPPLKRLRLYKQKLRIKEKNYDDQGSNDQEFHEVEEC